MKNYTSHYLLSWNEAKQFDNLIDFGGKNVECNFEFTQNLIEITSNHRC